jgi:hypothetical protein
VGRFARSIKERLKDVLLGERSVQEPGDDWQVPALIIGREDNGVFVLFGGRHIESVKVEQMN